jgi:5-methylcytosine-specific restriction endonuclease McrA
LKIKLDPGYKTTGIAIVNDQSGEVVFGAELSHRGHIITKALKGKREIRHSRRARHTRYRKTRFKNRKNKKKGWIAPSIESRVTNILTWVHRFRKLCPIQAISQELVKFDLQKMENPEISGIEYQQGTLQGYEIREYLLEKWERKCAYCEKENIPLQIEHIYPRAKGVNNRISNLTLACESCNQKKGTQSIETFLKNKPDTLKKLLDQVKKPLKDAAAVNITRWKLFERLKETGLPVEVGSGGLTKYNRTVRNLPKTHWIDAVNVGKSTPNVLLIKNIIPLLITANGYGNRQMCLMDKYGFPRTSPKGNKVVHGFQTGDIVKAVVTKGKKKGTYVGKVAIRSNGYFNITTSKMVIQGIKYTDCQIIHRVDGYSYQRGERYSSLA